jgi:hypothetical protein
MFFFGGFSSVLPYLAYLAIVWVCVLIGIKGDVWKNLNETIDTDQKIIAGISSTVYSEANVFWISEKNIDHKTNQVSNVFTISDKYAITGRCRLLYPTEKITGCQQTDLIASLSLRGPPFFYC